MDKSHGQELGSLGVASNFIELYIDNGRSILLLFLRASLTCFVIFMHKNSSNVMQTKMIASFICLKYNETAENTRKAKMISSHITKITTSTLHSWKAKGKTGRYQR